MGNGLRGSLLIYGLVFLAGCLEPAERACDFGVCPGDKVCDELHDECVFPDQLTSCGGRNDGDCTVGTQDGVCVDGVCLVRGCGDRRVNGAEQCDGDVFINAATDCTDLGYYDPGPIACTDECTIDVSMCHRTCGDDVKDVEEQCDYSLSQTVSCADLGYYDGVANCRLDCSVDISACARCGDDVLSPQEVCEPALGPPPNESCLDYSFDAGTLGCAASCTADVSNCERFGLTQAGEAHINGGAVVQITATKAYVVGTEEIAGVPKGVFYLWEGGVFTRVAMTDEIPQDISASSPTNAWAASESALLHFDGTTVTSYPIANESSLVATSTVSTTEAYATSRVDGKVYRFDGTNWTQLDATDGSHNNTAIFARTHDVWVVGSIGTTGYVRHWNGTSWNEFTFPAHPSPLSVWASSSTDAYVVGGSNVVYHLSGGTWTSIQVPVVGGTVVRFTRVTGTSADDVLLVGGNQLLHFDGASFAPVDLANTVALRDVSMFDREHALVVGGSSALLLYRWTGTARSRAAVLIGDARRVWGKASNAIYVTTAFGPYHFDGAIWNAMGTQLHSVLDATYVAGGGNKVFVVSDSGTLYTYNGDMQATQTPLGSIVMIDGGAGGLSAVSATEVWGATQQNGGQLFKFDGTTATFAIDTEVDVSEVYAASTNNVYVMTPQSILHYDGTAVTTQLTSAAGEIHLLFGTGPSNVYVVEGTTLHRFDGATWTTRSIPFTVPPTAIGGTADNDLWLGGEEGLWHYNGTAWSQVRTSIGEMSLIWADDRNVMVLGRGAANERIMRACATCL